MRPRSLKDYKSALNLLASKIDPFRAKEYKDVNGAIKEIKKERNWSARTAAKNATIIKNFYAWCHREGILEHNPFPFHEFKKPRPVEPDFLKPEDYLKILSNKALTLQETAIIRTLWETGIRRSECATISRSEVIFKEKGYVVHIPRDKSKGRYSNRFIPISFALAGLLLHLIEISKGRDHDRIFITKWGNPLNERDVCEIVERASKQVYLKVTPKMFRHAFGMRKLREGHSQLAVMNWLGHASLDMTNHYLHMTPEDSLELHNSVTPLNSTG